MLYKIFIRPFFFIFDAESVHNFVLKFLSEAVFLYPLFRRIYSPGKSSEVCINEIKFKNKLGLAAGFDKNGIAIRFWESIGFSHMEVGTVTPLPQTGNDRPRIFRLKKDEALINRLGFNNKGADEIRDNILEAKKLTGKDFVIGVNIGKNKATPVRDAVNDYRICFEKLYDAADYFTVNISSPNTEGLRLLQEEMHLDKLLSEIQKLNIEISKSKSSSLKCIFLKIAPDITEEMAEMIYNVSVENNITGIIATNTTVQKIKLKTVINEQGGLSGKPLKQMSDNILKKLNIMNSKNKNALILIGVGGVFSRSDFEDKINSGAFLVQIYTGFIYEGPSILKNILSV
ncbi:MAG TPA: quinone-dependent dihydroorotate dehydrogenase [Ignavibacteria bacterium]|nr:quinone-dependent dihydroorotate dehydrogenase [Ignavibacteria bacterium]